MGPMSARSARVLRSLNVRPGEGPLAGSVAAVFAVLEVARGFGEVAVDTMILGRFGPTGLPGLLPFLFMALGSVGLVVALAYGAALGRVRRERLFVGILVGAGLIMVALRIALAVGDTTVSAILWLAVYATGLLAMTLYWTLAGAAFDARQAKRLFPLLTGAAIVGSFVGTLGAGPMAALLGVENLVVLEAGLLAVAALLIGRIPVRRPAVAARPARPTSVVQQVRVGFDFVRGSPLMSLVATAYVLLSILMFSVSYPFLLAASAAFDDDVVVATVLGALSAGITATSLLVSVVVAPRIYARFGVTAGALLLPLVYVAGFGLWLVHFSFATAAIVRFTQQVTQRGISNAAWSSLYNTVPADRRGQVLAFIDGVPGQIGTILSGILLLAAGRILAPDQVLWLGVGTAVVATGVVVGIRRRYAGSLLAALRSGVAEQVLEGGPGVGALLRDPSVERALLDAMAAPEPGVREMATTLLGRLPSPSAGAALVTATGDLDARVRAGAVRALTGLDRDVSGVDLDRLDRDPDPAVRAAAIVLRAGRGGPLAFDLVDDPSPDIRAAAISTLPDGERREATLIAALDDGSLVVREAAATALAASGVATTAIVDVLTGGSSVAQRDRAGRPRPDGRARPGHRRSGRGVGPTLSRSGRRSPARSPGAPGRPGRRRGTAGVPRGRAGRPSARPRGHGTRGARGARSTRRPGRHPALPSLRRPRGPCPGHGGPRFDRRSGAGGIARRTPRRRGRTRPRSAGRRPADAGKRS